MPPPIPHSLDKPSKSDSRILSTLEAPAAHAQTTSSSAASGLVFDACHVGVMLRAVLVVQTVVAVVVMFSIHDFLSWLLDTSLVSAVTQPAVLLWLVVGCTLKKLLGRWPLPAQVACGIGLGMGAGVFAMGLLVYVHPLSNPRWLAAGLAGGLLASVLIAGLVWRVRAQTPATTQARLVELQSRIRPHFLFNTLNSAIALVRDEPERAEHLLEDLSELFRSALTDSKAEVTLGQELALARRYLDIETVRFGEQRLRLYWHLDPDADAARLPPLILQPLVENAVRHGVEPSPSGADIYIRTEKRGNRVVIKISNTIPAGTGRPGWGLALANVKERLQLLHDVQASFKSALVNGKFLVRLEIPS
jgi:two-component system, LytTR family, sensor histidine kinase AlgZ